MYRNWIVLLGIFGVVGWFIYAVHSSTGYFDYRSEIAGDKAGYYVYLPAIFIYDLQGDELPDNIISKVYNGFQVDSSSGLIRTKYSIGVAMMQAPAFLLIHAYQKHTAGLTDGFSGPYHNVPNVSAWIFASLGLWFMYRWLSNYYKAALAIGVILLVFFGTHLFYYAVRETAMSHVYSFFLFTALLWQLESLKSDRTGSLGFALMGVALGLMVVVRPLNILFIVAAVVFYRLQDRSFISKVTQPRSLLLLAFSMLVVFPQLWYWHELTGNWIYYSYENEGFANLVNPQFKSLLLAPLNGLLPYVPLYALMVLSSFIWLRRKPELTLFYVGFFILLSFILASWHRPQFGCGYSSRNYVEYLAIFALPLAELLHYLRGKRKGLLIALLTVFSIVNMKLTYAYETCFWGGSMWDWSEYRNMLCRGVYVNQWNPGDLDPDREFVMVAGFKNPALESMPAYAYAELSAGLGDPAAGDSTLLVMELWHSDSLWGWWGVNTADKLEEKPFSRKIHQHIKLPDNYPPGSHFKLLVWNKGRDSLELDYLRLWLR